MMTFLQRGQAMTVSSENRKSLSQTLDADISPVSTLMVWLTNYEISCWQLQYRLICISYQAFEIRIEKIIELLKKKFSGIAQ